MNNKDVFTILIMLADYLIENFVLLICSILMMSYECKSVNGDPNTTVTEIQEMFDSEYCVFNVILVSS